MTFNYDPFMVGFDRVLDRMNEINRAAGQQKTYPPYNIIKAGEDAYLIELAVAGFQNDDFDITLKDAQLTVKAERTATDEDSEYLHKGIAGRNFERVFTLADTIEVEDVLLEHGILTIRLRNVIPEEDQPKKFTVKSQKQLLHE